MPEVAFVMSDGQPFRLRELAVTLQYELDLQAVPSSLHVAGFPPPRPTLVYVLMDPSSYTRAEGARSLPADAVLRRTIFLCAEPPPSSDDDEHIALLRRAGAVFVLDQRSVVMMHRLGIPARLMRPGYSRSLDHFDPAASRPIDVMFLGTRSPWRTRHLARAARVLSRHNCLLQVCDETPSAGDNGSLSAQSRASLLAQTKVLISLHRGDGSRFDWCGALDAIHAGAVVASEHSSGIAPLVPDEHLVVASADSLPYLVDDLLRDEGRMARVRAQAHERLSSWIPYALSVAILRAAVVELVGEPVASHESLGELQAKPVAADLSTQPSAGADRHVEIEPSAQRARRTHLVHETPAWAWRRAPLVTAVTAVRGDAEQLTATLDSLAHSRLRDLELVVVDGASSKRTRRIAEEWMAERPRIAARLVVTEGGGLGAARNIGLDFARGRFCLILDSGQELYPRCLEVLTGTLDSMPEVAFAYPIQEVIGASDAFTEAGGDYLLSFLTWDPGRLRLRNDIHAPALIRSDRLRALGGFTSDPSLEGFEDYDLWCRLADRGWRGQLVPQALARRTESGSSPTLSGMHPSPGAWTSALIGRAPKLMSGAFLV